jgi:quercetin dioxygenase-like cupin family protein
VRKAADFPLKAVFPQAIGPDDGIDARAVSALRLGVSPPPEGPNTEAHMDAVNVFEYRGQSFKALCKTAKSSADVFTLPAGHDPGHEAAHGGDQIIYVIEGSATARVAGQEREVKAGDLVVIPAGTLHTLRTGAQPLFALTILAPPEM